MNTQTVFRPFSTHSSGTSRVLGQVRLPNCPVPSARCGLVAIGCRFCVDALGYLVRMMSFFEKSDQWTACHALFRSYQVLATVSLSLLICSCHIKSPSSTKVTEEEGVKTISRNAASPTASYHHIGRKELPVPGIHLIRVMSQVDELGHVIVGGEQGEVVKYDVIHELVLWEENLGDHVTAVRRDGAELYVGLESGKLLHMSDLDGQLYEKISLKVSTKGKKRVGDSALIGIHLIGGGVVVARQNGDLLRLNRSLKDTKLLTSTHSRLRTTAYDAKGNRVALGGESDQIILFSFADESSASISESFGWVTALAFSPAGDLAVATMDRVIHLTDGKTFSPEAVLKGHVRIISAMQYQTVDDKLRLLSSSLDRRTIVWNLQSKKPASELVGHRRQVVGLTSFARDHSGHKTATAITASGDGMIRTWPLPAQSAWNDRILPPPNQGEITIRSYTRGDRLRIRLLTESGAIDPRGYAAFNTMLSSTIDGRQRDLNPKVVKLFYKIVDHYGRDHEVILVSGYRSPEYNKQRTMQSKEVSKGSQHMAGNAIDFRIEGIPEIKLYEYAKSLKAGGVGLYLNSRFVHVDVGRVRTWGGT